MKTGFCRVGREGRLGFVLFQKPSSYRRKTPRTCSVQLPDYCYDGHPDEGAWQSYLSRQVAEVRGRWWAEGSQLFAPRELPSTVSTQDPNWEFNSLIVKGVHILFFSSPCLNPPHFLFLRLVALRMPTVALAGRGDCCCCVHERLL